MPKKVLIIHGLESNSREHWFLEEKERLERLGYEVTVPDMPNSASPRKEEWVQVIKDFEPDKESILIGHSLGGPTILRYLELATSKVGKCILIATPIRKLDEEYKAIDNFLEGGFDWEKIKRNTEKLVVFAQAGDYAVPLQHGKDLANHTNAELVIVEGNDHFDKIDFGLLEKYIK